MVVVAVVIGYILGIAPFIVPKIIERIDNKKNIEITKEEEKEQNEIFDEWLNGLQKVNQQDIYNEYVTGEETAKGD